MRASNAKINTKACARFAQTHMMTALTSTPRIRV